MHPQTQDLFHHSTHWVLDLVEQRSLSRRFVWTLFFVFCVFDWMTGNELSFEQFYLIPMFLAGLSYGWRSSLQLALCATGVGLAEGLWKGHHFSQPFLFYFDVFKTVASYSVYLVVVELLRNALWMQLQMSDTDSLTGLLNRRALIKALDSEHARMRRSKSTLGIHFVYCDNLSDLNDRLGNRVGDQALRSIANTLRMQLRDIDVVARFGGDEFAVLLPNSTDESTLHVAEKLKAALHVSMERQNWPVTFSIGVHVTQDGDANNAEALLSMADLAMYEAKKQGMNRIMAI